MADEKTVNSSVPEYESAVCQIREVISARIVADETGKILEIHVLAGAGRSPKQVVRDIESVFMVRYGLSIDYKKISVAQMKDEDNVNSGLEVRPRVVGVTVLLSGRKTEAKVQLEIGSEIYEGCATGPSTLGNKLRLVSQATVIALEEYLKGTCNILTEDIGLITLSGSQAVVVSITLVTNIGEERLVGSVFVKQDAREATVKATLAAVNRRMALLFVD